MGGVTVESYSANETVASCIETNPGSSGAPVSKIYYGSVTPFMNMTVSGFVWYQVSRTGRRMRARARRAQAPQERVQPR